MDTPVATPAAASTTKSAKGPDIDWGALVPRIVGAEVGPLSGVVPAAHASARSSCRRATAPREKLEALMDTGKRERIFPTEVGLEPTVVLDEVGQRQPEEIQTPSVVVAETPTAVVAVHDTLTVTGSAGTAVVTATPTATVTEAVTEAATEPATPQATVDEPSDGVVQVATAEPSTPARRPHPPEEIPDDDRPDPTKGEIRTAPAAPPATVPALTEPSILVADLAAAHTAVSAAASAQVEAPASADIASASRELVVADVRKDALTAFSDVEEEFFRAGAEKATKAPVAPVVESFDDLDEGYQPVGFWDRLRGKKPHGAERVRYGASQSARRRRARCSSAAGPASRRGRGRSPRAGTGRRRPARSRRTPGTRRAP